MTLIIGVDPHKSSHTATALDPATKTPVASLRIDASLAGYRQLRRWAKQFDERRWAIEGARGLGRHLAEWLVAREEVVVDVPSTATARVRELSRGSRRKTDVIDAAAAACVAALQGDATPVASEDHTTVFAMLEERRANLAAQRVRVANQLHAVLRELVPETLIGYARCSTDEQDLTAQRETLLALGVEADRICIDHGMSGTRRERPGLDQALAAVREGNTLVVPKLDRLARSVPDARDIGDTLAQRGVVLSLGGRTYDPDDPMGKMFFNILATFAEFEVDLIRMRTREGMAVARAQGKLKGRQRKLSPKQQRELKRMHQTGEYTITDLGELFSVSRPTVYRTINRTVVE